MINYLTQQIIHSQSNAHQSLLENLQLLCVYFSICLTIHPKHKYKKTIETTTHRALKQNGHIHLVAVYKFFALHVSLPSAAK